MSDCPLEKANFSAGLNPRFYYLELSRKSWKAPFSYLDRKETLFLDLLLINTKDEKPSTFNQNHGPTP